MIIALSGVALTESSIRYPAGTRPDPTDFDIWSNDIDWGGVGRDLGNIAIGALDVMGAGVGAGALIKGLTA